MVGEAPGEKEDLRGLPFVGQSGDLLRPILSTAIGDACSRAGLPSFSVWYTNAVRCRPCKAGRNRTPTKPEINNCAPFLLWEILKLRPKLILTTGKIPQAAVNSFLDKLNYTPLVRNVYHPAYIMRKPGERKAWELAILHVIEELVEYDSNAAQTYETVCSDGLASPFGAEVVVTSPKASVVTGDIDWTAPILGVDTEYDTDDKGDTEDEQSYVLVQVSDGRNSMAWRRQYADAAVESLSISGDTTSPSPSRIAYAHVRADLPRLGLSWDSNWEDVLLAAYVLRLPVGLKALTQRVLGIPMRTYTDLVTWDGKKHKFSEALDNRFEEAWEYAVRDPYVTAKCWEVISKMLDAEPKLKNCYYEFERPLVPVLHQIEQNGVLVDADVLEGLRNRLEKSLDDLKEWSVKEFGVANIASSKQVAEWLMETGWEPTRYTETGDVATGEVILAELAENTEDPYVGAFIGAVLEQRALTKFNSTYVKRLLKDRDESSRIHTQYHQTVTETGRLSSSRPNLQNIPGRSDIGKELRKAFKARPGYVWLRGDYSQVEVRLFAHFTQEPVLVKAYNTPGADVHQSVAEALGIDRKPAKNTLFCVTPESKVLTEDLRWVEIGSLEVGDKLVGFDEYIDGSTCRFKPAQVEATARTTKPCYRVTTDLGVVTASADHMWVMGKRHYSRHWVTTENLQVGDELVCFSNTWETTESHNSGYIQGFMDGEGYVSKSGVVGFGQNPGPVLDHVCSLLESDGWTLHKDVGQKCTHVRVVSDGGIAGHKAAEFLGTYRPQRLMEKSHLTWDGQRTWGRFHNHAQVLNVEYLGEREVVALQTSTHTMIVEGLLSHNCIIYGGGADKAAVTAGVQSNRAGVFLERIRKDMPSLLMWPKMVEVFLENHGYVETEWGFRNYYPMFWSPLNRDRAEALRQAGNQPIQGTAAQIMKLWMVRMKETFDRYDCMAVVQVHDELGVECPISAVAEVAEAMERIGSECGKPEITVPLIVEVSAGPNWIDQTDWREWVRKEAA